MIEISDEKVLLFSDLHWGKGRDSSIKIKSMDFYIDWLLKQCKKHDIKTIIFLGDWFDCRSSISVKTMNHSFAALQKISKMGIQIYLFVGNHDAYFKDTIEVNSLKPLNEIENVTVIGQATEVHFTNSGRTGGFMPWDAFVYEDFKDKNWDVMFGHFEFMGAAFHASGSLTCAHGSNGNEMTKVAPLCFSGHFHARKEYNFKNGKVVTIGCPLELDWGDYGNSKGYYILDTGTLDYTFYENTISPKHHKLFWSKIKSGKEKYTKVKNNYVKLIVDDEYKFEEVMKEVTKINLKGPLKPCDTEFTHNQKFDIFCSDDADDISRIPVHRSKMDYIELFVEKTDYAADMGLDKSKAIDILKQYYASHNHID
jgi:DNA repair exonuclease SbcCD nuclease subunit